MLGNEAPLVIKRSLKEHDRRRAARLSRFLAVQLENFITLNGWNFMNSSDRKRVLFEYLEQQIDEWKLLHASGPRLTKEQLNSKIEQAACDYNECIKDLSTANLFSSSARLPGSGSAAICCSNWRISSVIFIMHLLTE